MPKKPMNTKSNDSDDDFDDYEVVTSGGGFEVSAWVSKEIGNTCEGELIGYRPKRGKMKAGFFAVRLSAECNTIYDGEKLISEVGDVVALGENIAIESFQELLKTGQRCLIKIRYLELVATKNNHSFWRMKVGKKLVRRAVDIRKGEVPGNDDSAF